MTDHDACSVYPRYARTRAIRPNPGTRHDPSWSEDSRRPATCISPAPPPICRHLSSSGLLPEFLISFDYFHVGAGADAFNCFIRTHRRSPTIASEWPGRHETNAFADVCFPRHFSATSIPVHQRSSPFVIVCRRPWSCSVYLVERREGSALDEEV
jgi:hypothetical protein